MGEIDVLDELKIVHPDADEIGAALKAPAKSILRANRTCGKRLEGDPGLLQRLHVRNDGVRVVAVLVVLSLRVAEGPVIAPMERLHPEIGFQSMSDAAADRFQTVAANTCWNTVGSDQFQRLRHQVPVSFSSKAVGDGAMHITGRGAVVDGGLDSGQNIAAAAIRDELDLTAIVASTC